MIESKDSVVHKKSVRQLMYTSAHIPVLMAFFLSGFSALVFQVLWQRLLTLQLGATVHATAIVLSAFMAGLAVGSWLLGRYADRFQQPLRVFAWLELSIGLYGLLTPLLLGGFSVVYGLFYSLAGDVISDYALLFDLLRFILVFVVLFVATVLMGGTLPVLIHFWVRRLDGVGQGVATLYGINTLGAVCGAGLAGFVLMPAMGMTMTLYIASAVSILTGLVMWGLSLRSAKVSDSAEVSQLDQQLEPGVATDNYAKPAKTVLGLAMLAGFIALACEVIWTRVLSEVIGSTVYSFSLILVIFLGGLAAGSLIMIRLSVRVAHYLQGRERLFVSFVLLLMALSILTSHFLLGRIPLWLLDASVEGFWWQQWISFIACVPVILPTALLSGMLLPMLSVLYVQRLDAVSEQFGKLYAFNTAGSIFGSLVAGFILIAWLGASVALMVLAGLCLAASLLLLSQLSLSSQYKRRTTVAVAIAVVLLFVLPAWNPLLLNSNFPVMGKILVEYPDILQRYLESELVYQDEDASADVLVYKDKRGGLNLHVNGHAEGGTRASDMHAQQDLAVLPAVLHDAPSHVLLVGLGTGVTLATLEADPNIKQIDVVEISSAVAEAQAVFSGVTGDVFNDPRVSLYIDDARHFLQRHDKRYDLVVIAPSYSWVSGSASLFTREFLQLAADRLEPDGRIALWFHLYLTSPDVIKVFARTVSDVFPVMSAWLTEPMTDLVLVAGRTPMQIEYATFSERLSVFDRLGHERRFTASEMLARYLTDDKGLAKYAGEGMFNVDDRPYLEFAGPRTLSGWDLTANLDGLFTDIPVVSVPVKKLTRKQDDSLYLDYMALSVPASWQVNAAVINSNKVLSAAKHQQLKRATPVRRSVPQAMLETDDFKVEVRASIKGQGSEYVLRETVAKVSGMPIQAVQQDTFHGKPVFWTGRAVKARGLFIMSWYCGDSGVQYLLRYLAKEQGRATFTDVLETLEGLHCIVPDGGAGAL